jgi:amidase
MIDPITREDLNTLAAAWVMNPPADELEQLAVVAEGVLAILSGLDERDDLPAPVAAARDPGRRAQRDEDPLNAIVRHCTVRAHDSGGALVGLRVALKDSMPIAGIPLTAGSALLGDYVPEADSVLAERLLRAGAEIVAVTNMDDLAFSGGGDSSFYGPTLNPFDRSRTAAGSSGGSAAALYYPNIDVGMGTDQGGSIRAPAAWCGCLGLKPTYSLVPYTGIMGIDATFDHAGPITRGIDELARVMDVIAGAHPSDPRQQRPIPVQEYLLAAERAPQDLRGLRVGVVEEGFSESVGIDPRVAEAVRASALRLESLGAEVRSVSLPEHVSFGDVAFAGFIEGMTALMTGGGNGYHWAGRYSPDLALAIGEGLATRADQLSPQVKATLMLGLHLRRTYHGSLYARAQNARPKLRAGYDRLLADSDVLLMPTTPGIPHEHVVEIPVSERVLRGWALLANTTPTDMSGHPALTMPMAEVEGLPVGVMIIGRHFDDARLISVAATCEREIGWRPQTPPDL